MKHTTFIFLFVAIFGAATAQQTEITLSRSDYKMQDGQPVVTNDSLLRMLHRGTVKTVYWETPHNGRKVLKAYRDYSYPAPTDCDGYLWMFNDTTLCFHSPADSVLPYKPLWTTDYIFRNLKYSKSVAEIHHCTHVEDFCEYECRGEIDDGNHEFPASAIVFIYSEESYYIPINGGSNWDDIKLGDSVCLTMTVYRDRRGHYEEKPYAEVTAVKRICIESEVDTLGRIFCYSGDTIVFTHKDANWKWEQHSFYAATGDSSVKFVEYWPLLQMNEAFCQQINKKNIRFVERYDRCNHRWRKIYAPRRKRNSAETQQEPACTLTLEEI